MNPKVRAWLETLPGKYILVLGLGVSNRPLVRMLLEAGCEVTGCDATPYEKLEPEVLALEARGCRLKVGPDYLEGLEGDVVFRTPGLHPARPELAALKASGAQITSEMEAFFRVCPCPIIAVTGSDGKTTTTTLISELLKQAGRRVWLGGNIGTPLLPLAEQMEPEDFAVVELSSFQLMDFPLSAHIAVITNLAPNHLDVHKDMAEYVDAKRNIYRHQGPGDTLILNLDNALTHAMRSDAPGECLEFSRLGKPEKGVYLVDGEIRDAETGEVVLKQADILLPGLHNVENYMAAICAVRGLAGPEDIRQVARTFGGVEHRIELVRIKDGVRYYNDSIASSPSRTIAGLRSFPEKVILIAGGYDKHIPYDVLGPEICAHVKLLVLNGATAPLIRDAVLACPDPPEIIEADGLSAAVHAAADRAEAGDVVLLSPASAAFDQFKNFMVRGSFFKELVREL